MVWQLKSRVDMLLLTADSRVKVTKISSDALRHYNCALNITLTASNIGSLCYSVRKIQVRAMEFLSAKIMRPIYVKIDL